MAILGARRPIGGLFGTYVIRLAANQKQASPSYVSPAVDRPMLTFCFSGPIIIVVDKFVIDETEVIEELCRPNDT